MENSKTIWALSKAIDDNNIFSSVDLHSSATSSSHIPVKDILNIKTDSEGQKIIIKTICDRLIHDPSYIDKINYNQNRDSFHELLYLLKNYDNEDMFENPFGYDCDGNVLEETDYSYDSVDIDLILARISDLDEKRYLNGFGKLHFFFNNVPELYGELIIECKEDGFFFNFEKDTIVPCHADNLSDLMFLLQGLSTFIYHITVDYMETVGNFSNCLDDLQDKVTEFENRRNDKRKFKVQFDVSVRRLKSIQLQTLFDKMDMPGDLASILEPYL